MNEFLTYEYSVTPPIKGKRRRLKILLIAAYIVYCAVLLLTVMTVGKLFLPLFALVPLTLWIIIFFTWRYTNPEYEYSITSGVLTFARIFGGRSRQKVFEQTVKQMETIAPLSKTYSHKIDEYRPTRVYEGSSSHDSPDAYFALFENENGERCVYYFEATDRALKVLRHYNVKTVVTDVRY